MRTGDLKRATAGDQTICLLLAHSIVYDDWIEDSASYWGIAHTLGKSPMD